MKMLICYTLFSPECHLRSVVFGLLSLMLLQFVYESSTKMLSLFHTVLDASLLEDGTNSQHLNVSYCRDMTLTKRELKHLFVNASL